MQLAIPGDQKSEYHAYCNLCNLGFASIDELTKHQSVNMNKHRDIMQERYDQTRQAQQKQRQANSAGSSQGETPQGKKD